MAARIVLLGWGGDALELASMDAEVLVKGRRPLCRVSFTKWGGPLADATVLTFLVRPNDGDGAEARKLMKLAKQLCPNGRPLQIDRPIPVGVERPAWMEPIRIEERRYGQAARS